MKNPFPKKSNSNVTLVTLGCSKNTVDSERLAGVLYDNGHKVDYENENTLNPIVIINTCGFINDAKEESINTILQYVEEKKNGKVEKIIVWGCLTERYKTELLNEIPEIDAIYGIEAFEEISKLLNQSPKSLGHNERIVSTPNHYAYLKISDGCNRKCAFCAIPKIKGKHRSSPIENLVEEASLLAHSGVKELILVAQDLTSYGLDIYHKKSLHSLIVKLHDIAGIEWIRLHYAYPVGFPTNILDLMQEYPKICKYLDIPFQHISDNMLKRMKRGNTKASTYQIVEKIRKKVDGIALRTTLIVGFPGETKKEFEELVDFVKEVRFERLGVFKYSDEESTSAYSLKSKVSEKIMQSRFEQLMEVQQGISFEKNQLLIGSIQKTIIDRKEGDFFIGRTQFDSPEIDNEIIIPFDKKIKSGHFYNIRISEANEFDLKGILAE